MNKELQGKVLDILSWALCTAYSEPQKHAMKERDSQYGTQRPKRNKGICQFPIDHECNGDRHVHLHHIKPQGYMMRMGLADVMDTPQNGLYICEKSHVGSSGVHPDQPSCKDEYTNGDKEAYKKLQDRRRQSLEQRQIYWRDTWDRLMEIQALRNTMRAIKNGWSFPKGGKNGEAK